MMKSIAAPARASTANSPQKSGRLSERATSGESGSSRIWFTRRPSTGWSEPSRPCARAFRPWKLSTIAAVCVTSCGTSQMTIAAQTITIIAVTMATAMARERPRFSSFSTSGDSVIARRIAKSRSISVGTMRRIAHTSTRVRRTLMIVATGISSRNRRGSSSISLGVSFAATAQGLLPVRRARTGPSPELRVREGLRRVRSCRWRSGSRRSSREHAHSRRACDYDLGRETAEQAVLDDAGAFGETLRERARLENRREDAVEDPIALIGLVRRAGLRLAQRGPAPERADVALLRLHAEARDLDGKRVAHAERGRQLRLVDDDDDLRARLSDDLLAQERAASALDQIE